MKQFEKIAAVIAILLQFLHLQSAISQTSTHYAIQAFAVDQGGAVSTSTHYTLIDAIGQAGPACTATSTGFNESSGFLAFLTRVIPESFRIIVDGNKDDFYSHLTNPDDGYLQLRSYAWNDNGIPDNDADLSAKIWSAWDEDWFYLYEEVMDDRMSGDAANVWEEDCLELNFDPRPTDSVANSVWQTRMTALDWSGQDVVAADNMNNVADDAKQMTRKIIRGGYVLELALKWSAIQSNNETISPNVGNIFGMAINQHDNDGGARRVATVQWAAVLLDAVWNTPRYLASVKFSADHKLQFIARNSMTGVTNPVPYNGSDYTRNVVEEAPQTTPELRLQQNYPNPFNPVTTIDYSIASYSHVRLIVYDVLGRETSVLVDGKQPAGEYHVVFDGRLYDSSIYFIKLFADSQVFTRKMVMVR